MNNDYITDKCRVFCEMLSHLDYEDLKKSNTFLYDSLKEQEKLLIEKFKNSIPMKATFDSMDTTSLETRGEVRAFNRCRNEILINLDTFN